VFARSFWIILVGAFDIAGVIKLIGLDRIQERFGLSARP
jgi:hypothetical protein